MKDDKETRLKLAGILSEFFRSKDYGTQKAIEDILAIMTDSQDLTCPFCETEHGFDKIGLKTHIENYCESYQNIHDLP